MSNEFIDKLTLLINVNPGGGATTIKGFVSTVQSDLNKVTTGGALSGRQWSQGFADQALFGLAALRATVGTLGVVSFAKSSAQDAVTLARANAQLTAAEQSTGNEAGVSNAQLDRLSQTIQKQYAIFTGTTKGAAAYLATLTDVRNQSGAGNDVFNRTLVVSAAVANVMGTDMVSAAQTLGRALENPVLGVRQLQRAQIPLSNALVVTARNLAQNGDLMGAQKAILDELEKRYVSAGAAIAKADPFQQFSVELTKFKTQAGQDILPVITPTLKGIGSMFDAFSKLPSPIRYTAETLATLGIAVIPLTKLVGVLNGLGTIKIGGSGAAGEAAALEAEAAATAATGDAAVVASGQLTLFGGAEAEAAAGADALAASEAVATAATAGFEIGLGTLAGGFGIVLAGLIAFQQGSALLDSVLGVNSKSFKNLSTDTNGLVNDFKRLDDKGLVGNLSNFAHLPSMAQSKRDVKDLVGDLESLADSQGPLVAFHQLQDMEGAFIRAGGSADEFQRHLGPVYDYLHQLFLAEKDAATGANDLATTFDQFATSLDKLKDANSVADAFDALSAAEQKVVGDQQDIAGTSDKAVQAQRDVADAYRGVQDAQRGISDANQRLADSYYSVQQAQERVADATTSLARAQKALQDFNSPRSQLERTLQLDQINRRVVTTPEEEDQKRLDLLQFQDRNNQQKQSLQDQVTSATRSLRDATHGLADAERGVADAKQGVIDATQREKDAEQKLADSVRARQKVHDDAEKAIAGDERKVKEAVLNVIDAIDKASKDAIDNGTQINDEIKKWVTNLDKVANAYAPGSTLTKNINKFFDNLKTKSDAAAGGTGAGQPNDPNAKGQVDPLAPSHTGVPSGPDTFNPPSFDVGGFVPGAEGAPLLALVHGGERVLTRAQQRGSDRGEVNVNQTNHFYGGDGISRPQDLAWANAQLAWRVARLGRGS